MHWKNVITTIATCGPVGKKLPAPGTFGTLIGVGLYCIFSACTHGVWAYALLTFMAIFGACYACGVAATVLKQRDPRCAIIDEVVAMPVVYAPLYSQNLHWDSTTFILLLVGFLAFRFFDILKPLGIHHVERWNGGIGMVADDILAAVYSACFLSLFKVALFG